MIVPGFGRRVDGALIPLRHLPRLIRREPVVAGARKRVVAQSTARRLGLEVPVLPRRKYFAFEAPAVLLAGTQVVLI